MRYELAQLNVARLAAPLYTPRLKDFVANLDPVNAMAEAAPGFVWRLQGEAGDATALRPWEPDLIVNMSVWASIQALHDFTYGSGHSAILRRRREWFIPMDTPLLVLWWTPVGHRPTLDEARERLDLLTANGSSPAAFTLRASFPAPE